MSHTLFIDENDDHITNLDWRCGVFFLTVTSIAPFVVMLAWVGAVTAGHTKRKRYIVLRSTLKLNRFGVGTTTNAIVMIGYAVGNAVGTQYWKKAYQPRNHIPWSILSACWFASMIIMLMTRFYLARENAKREREEPDSTYDDVYINEGIPGEKPLKVDKVCIGVGYFPIANADRLIVCGIVGFP